MELNSLEQVLGQLRTAAALAAGGVKPQAAQATEPGNFATLLKASIDQVSGMQQQAAAKARDFELGTPNVDLHDVMVSLQKANVSFQQMVQVRNRLVSAYHDIMNMQV